MGGCVCGVGWGEPPLPGLIGSRVGVCLSVCAFVRSGDGLAIFAGMAELMLLELSLLIEIAWDRLNWKIWFEEAARADRGCEEASLCPFSPTEHL